MQYPGKGRPTGGVRPSPSPGGPPRGYAKGDVGKGRPVPFVVPRGGVKIEASIVVYSSLGREDAGLRTLVGEYAEEGNNHGRKTFKKVDRLQGHEDLDVYLYFWDARDGEDYSGWWFGDKVGGSQVWSKNVSKSMQPPKIGWTIPWDGPVKKDLMVTTPAEKRANEQKGARTMQMARMKEEEEKVTVNWEERVEKATMRAAEVRLDADAALETAKLALDTDEVDEDAIKVAAEQLAKSAVAVTECQRFIAGESLASQKAPPELKREVAFLNQSIRALQASVKDEQHRVKNYKLIKQKEAEEETKRVEAEAKNQELTEQQQRQLEEMMPSIIEKVNSAEDEAEKVEIAAAPLQVEQEDALRPVMLEAIKETEQRVRAAQAAISEAKRFLAAKTSQVQKFHSDVKETALQDFDSLQEKLAESQKKINPYKSIRQDFEQRLQGKKILDELNAKISGAEIEVEKAAMMTAPAGGDSMEGIKETESALSAAQSALATSLRLVDSKLKTLDKQSDVYDEVKSLQERAKSAQEKLDQIRKNVKETQVRVAADSLLKEAGEKVSSAEDELQKMSEAEMPFLRGNPKGSEMEELIKKAEELSAQVQTALSDAQAFVAKKLVEVARFSEGHAKVVREDLDALQKRLADGRMRLQKFRASTADHKRQYMLEEVDVKITAAEADVQKMTEANAALGTMGTAGDTISDSATAKLEHANAAERTAQAGIILARKCLLQKTAELKSQAITGVGSGSELGKFQTRVNNMQHEVAKLRNATKDAEERLRAKQTLAEVAMRCQSAEVEVDKVAAAAAPTDDELPSVEVVERIGKQSSSAQTKLGATTKLVEIKLRSASGFLKEELQGMKARLLKADKKLQIVLLAFREQKERVLSSEIIAEATSKVESAETALQKASQSELPFLKGIEVEAKEATAAVALCETATAEAQKCITAARSYAVEQMAEAKQFSEKPSSACTKELVALQKKLDAAAARLAELKKDTADRKRRTQMQASAEKITDVEAAVQALATLIAKFSDDKLEEFSSDEARQLLEEIGVSEESAQRTVSNARKFLAQRLQDMKGFSESQRAPMTADLTKLQSRLTQCQVELAKLSKQCTEREQRYVAQKLIEDASSSLEKLKVDIEKATKVAASALTTGAPELVKAAYAQSVVGAMQTHMRKSNVAVDALFAMMTRGKSASLAEFVAFLGQLSELTGKDEIALSEKVASGVFAEFAGNKDALTLAHFQAACRDCHLCTVAVELMSDAKEGAQEVGVLEVGEAAAFLEKTDTHAHCVLARDGTKGWARLQDEDGSANFKASQSGASSLESIFAFVASINARCSEAAENVEQKAIEVSSVKQGPLVAVKPKLQELQLKIRQEQSKTEQLKSQLSATKAEVAKTRREEQQSMQEVKCKEFATNTVKEATQAVEAGEKKAEVVIKSAKDVGAESTISQLKAAKASADDALKSLEDAKAVVARIRAAYEGFKSTSKPLLLEARVEVTKLAHRADTAHVKCRTATDPIRAACAKQAKAATQKARGAVRALARSSGKSHDQMFSQITGGKDEMTEAQFSKFVAGLPDHGLSKEQISLIYHEFGKEGLKQTGFAEIVQEYCTCSKAIAITDAFDIESAKTVRKLEHGEVFEVLEGPKILTIPGEDESEKTQVPRVRGRALRDAATGWVSVQGNQGTPFLKATGKPFLSAVGDTPLKGKFDDASSTVRAMVSGEILEVVEGPRQNKPEPEIRLHCKASKDAVEGWITMSSGAGVHASKSSSYYVCRSVIAMTDVFDLKSCKVIKKVGVGETLELVGDPAGQEDSKRDINRRMFRSARDGKEGWVTLKGNQGTVYLEVSTSHYLIDHAVALRAEAATAAETVRKLEAGESVEAIEPPTEEKVTAQLGILARAMSDGKSGWIIFSGQAPPVKPLK